MRFIDEYRDASAVKGVLAEIEKTITQPWVLMEVCGGQTHSIIRHGLHQLLPAEIELVHGPGCPVCVTPLELIDKALALAELKDVILASYGDMLRVPGSAVCSKGEYEAHDLFCVKSRGGDVRIVYSPLDAVEIARKNPNQMVVFFAIGFETTAPANGMAILQAAKEGLDNFCALVSHVTVPPAICAIMDAPDCRVDGFLAAGHVCTVMGMREYEPIAQQYQIPIVVTGFEPLDLVYGVLKSVRQLESGEFKVENAYRRTASDVGNLAAQRIIESVFDPCDRAWRGIGMIPQSGYRIRDQYAQYDAEVQFPEVEKIRAIEPDTCCSGEVLQGKIKPDNCPEFGIKCTPLSPLGATMVSNEGACAAYYRYGRAMS